MLRRFGWIAIALGMTAFGTASATRPAPVRPAPTTPEFGGCVYDCSSNGVRYRTLTQCRAACGAGFCEPIC